jgi:hypothetical protein
MRSHWQIPDRHQKRRFAAPVIVPRVPRHGAQPAAQRLVGVVRELRHLADERGEHVLHAGVQGESGWKWLRLRTARGGVPVARIIGVGAVTASLVRGTAMPVHDWTRVDAGLFHAFHQFWITTLCSDLNARVLPPRYFALPEQEIKGPIPDVLTLHLPPGGELTGNGTVGVAVATAPPRTRVKRQTEEDLYAGKTSRITVRHRHGDVVAVIEIISPGNKGSQAEFRAIVEKSADLIRQHVHVLIIDLFPPGKRDPHGIHKAIWDEFREEDFDLPPEKPLILASYSAGQLKTAYVEPIGVGDPLPDMPLFLLPEIYVPAPLEATYQTAWGLFPAPLKGLLDVSTH